MLFMLGEFVHGAQHLDLSPDHIVHHPSPRPKVFPPHFALVDLRYTQNSGSRLGLAKTTLDSGQITFAIQKLLEV